MAEAHIAARIRQRGPSGVPTRTPSSARSGAVEEADFEKIFAETPHVTIHSARHLEEEIVDIQTIVGNEKSHWETRVAALRKFRGLVRNGAQDSEQFFQLLRELEEPFSKAVVDLRSQLVREACVAISFAAVSIGLKFDHFAAAVLPSLFQVLSNSAKIIASSGHVCIVFIVKHVHSHSLVPLFVNTMTSRSSAIRRRGAEYISQLLSTWEAKHMDRHTQEIENAISKAVVDSDPGARAAGRNAFWSYSDHFKRKADRLMATFDSGIQKLLHQNRPSNTAVLSTPSRTTIKKSSLPPKMSKTFHSSAPDLTEDQPTPSRRKGTTHPPPTPNRIIPTVGGRGGTPSRRADFGSSAARRHPLDHTTPNSEAMSPNHVDPLQNHVPDSVHQWVTTTRGRTPKRSASSPTSSPRDLSPVRPSRLQTPRTHKSPRTPKKYTFLSKEALDSLTRRVRKDSAPGDSDDDAGSVASDVSFSSTMSEMISTRFNLVEDTRRDKVRGIVSDSLLDAPRCEPIPLQCYRGSGIAVMVLPVHSACESLAHHVHCSLHDFPAPACAQTAAAPTPAQRSKCMNKRQHKATGKRKTVAVHITNKQKTVAMHINSKQKMVAMHINRRQKMVAMLIHGHSDLNEIVAMGRSTSWTDRKDAIMSIHHVLQSPRTFSKPELKKITNLCQRFFVEPHSKVFGLYLEFLGDFVSIHSVELHDWLFVLLLRLLHKVGCEIRGSLSRRLANTLRIVRESFPTGLQLTILMRIILDQTQPMNPKTKLAVLNFLLELIPIMDPQDLQNVADMRLGVTKLITFTSEPKSVAIRRAACCVLIALFDLNTATFTILLTQLSKHFRDIATRILQHHAKKESAGQDAVSSLPLRLHEQPTAGVSRSPSGELPRTRGGGEPMERQRKGSAEKVSLPLGADVTSPTQKRAASPASRIPYPKSNLPTSNSVVRGDSPLTSTDVSPGHSVAKSAQRQLSGSELALRRKSPSVGTLVTPTAKEPDIRRVSESASEPASEPAVERHAQGGSPVMERSSDVGAASPQLVSEYNPARYQDVNGLNGQTDSDEVTESEPAEFLSTIQNLASPDSTSVEKALKHLIELARDEVFEFWEKHFSVAVTQIFTHLKNKTSSVRSQALRAFYEVLRSQTVRFTPLTVEVTRHCLEASKDSVENISKSVDELIIPLANAVDPCECADILTPVVARESMPVLLIALKLLTKVIERLTPEQLVSFLPQIMPGLVTAYSHSASGVRKASVFCMVSVHVAVGEQMAPFLTQLTGSQMKLLNLYIKRAMSTPSSPTSQTSR